MGDGADDSRRGDTRFQASSGGLIVLRGVNAVAITPKVRQAIEEAFAPADVTWPYRSTP